MIHGVYVITDETLFPGRSHVDIARAAICGGASIIQLRDKTASDDYMIRAGLEIREMASETDVLFIVNDRLEVALACDADGLHIGQEDRRASEIRPLLQGKILGVSVDAPEQAARAREDGADYLGVGPILSTSTKSDAGMAVGLSQIGVMRRASGELPIVAIGGINEENIAEVARAGANSAAVVSAVACAEDMAEATRRLVRRWEGMIGEE